MLSSGEICVSKSIATPRDAKSLRSFLGNHRRTQPAVHRLRGLGGPQESRSCWLRLGSAPRTLFRPGCSKLHHSRLLTDLHLCDTGLTRDGQDQGLVSIPSPQPPRVGCYTTTCDWANALVYSHSPRNTMRWALAQRLGTGHERGHFPAKDGPAPHREERGSQGGQPGLVSKASGKTRDTSAQGRELLVTNLRRHASLGRSTPSEM